MREAHLVPPMFSNSSDQKRAEIRELDRSMLDRLMRPRDEVSQCVEEEETAPSIEGNLRHQVM